MARFSLHAVGRDRPGIVAAVAEAIAAMGWNLEDSAMTMLQGQFAIVLILDAREISNGRVVETALAPVAEELDLFFAVRPVAEDVVAFEQAGLLEISIAGADRPGIVARVARQLADVGADIRELVSHLVETDEGQGYVMQLTVALPPATSTVVLEATLLVAAVKLGVDCTVTTIGPDPL